AEHGAPDAAEPDRQPDGPLHVRAARLPAASMARGLRPRHAHRGDRRLAWTLSAARHGAGDWSFLTNPRWRPPPAASRDGSPRLPRRTGGRRRYGHRYRAVAALRL